MNKNKLINSTRRIHVLNLKLFVTAFFLLSYSMFLSFIFFFLTIKNFDNTKKKERYFRFSSVFFSCLSLLKGNFFLFAFFISIIFVIEVSSKYQGEIRIKRKDKVLKIYEKPNLFELRRCSNKKIFQAYSLLISEDLVYLKSFDKNMESPVTLSLNYLDEVLNMDFIKSLSDADLEALVSILRLRHDKVLQFHNLYKLPLSQKVVFNKEREESGIIALTYTQISNSIMEYKELLKLKDLTEKQLKIEEICNQIKM